MNVTRFDTAPEYFPADHERMRCLRLQGKEAGPASHLWLGASLIEPGGSTSFSAASVEKHYVVLEGEIQVRTEGGLVTLRRFDSCRLAPGERRALFNASNEAAIVLLAMPLDTVGAR
ncbi:MAG TPA: cupin domain-containing protein [Trinickia sp.]|nr:cupin domain-containing protein [Trinickia sp.]